MVEAGSTGFMHIGREAHIFRAGGPRMESAVYPHIWRVPLSVAGDQIPGWRSEDEDSGPLPCLYLIGFSHNSGEPHEL